MRYTYIYKIDNISKEFIPGNIKSLFSSIKNLAKEKYIDSETQKRAQTTDKYNVLRENEIIRR